MKLKVGQTIIVAENFTTEDYQKRGDRGPKSNVPDSIWHGSDEMSFTFKSTTEQAAKACVTRFLAGKGIKFKSMDSNQDGDYHDDWVNVTVELAK